MEYLEHTIRYVRSEYRLMQAVRSGNDKELAVGTLRVCQDKREELYAQDPVKFPMGAFYIQAYYPNGHPEFPGSGSCWVMYDGFTGQ